MFKPKFKKSLWAFFVLVSVALLGMWYCNWHVEKLSSPFLFDSIKNLPKVKTGLLLGTSKYVHNGHLNKYYKNRIDATEQLYKSGKIRFIVISGDNSRKEYDEPTEMKRDLIARGIDSTKIYLDYAGFRTLDSVVRLKEIFGQDSCIVISQKFHNERALYIALNKGLHFYGFNAKDVGKRYGFKTQIREKFARVKVIVDLLINKQPKFLGEKILLK